MIYPVDYKKAGRIVDDVRSSVFDLSSFMLITPMQEMHLIMVRMSRDWRNALIVRYFIGEIVANWLSFDRKSGH